jgi:hypothetical protein
MSDKKIFLLRYNGGMGGDFLSSAISNDTNFYQYPQTDKTSENAWNVLGPFEEKFRLFLKQGIAEEYIDEFNSDTDLINKIDKEFNSKNLVITIHYSSGFPNLRFPRKELVNLYCSKKIAPFFFGLIWLKRQFFKSPVYEYEKYEHEPPKWLVRREIMTKTGNIVNFHKWTGDSEEDTFLKKKYNEILLNKNFTDCYSFEKIAMLFKLKDPFEVAQPWFKRYWEIDACTKVDGYNNLDIGEFFLNLEQQIPVWQTQFNMNATMDYDTIKNYHNKNIELFENAFNMNYLDCGDHLDEFFKRLRTYAEQKCPEAYLIE